MLHHHKRNEHIIATYCWTLFFGAMRFLKALELYTGYRDLSNALQIIVRKVKPALVFFVIAFVYYSNITFIQKNNDNKDFFKVILKSYDYAFGNWTLKSDNTTWYNVMHMIFAFCFAIAMTNILITLVGESYIALRENQNSIETTLYVRLALKGIQYRKICRCFRKQNKRKGTKLYVLDKNDLGEIETLEIEDLDEKITEIAEQLENKIDENYRELENKMDENYRKLENLIKGQVSRSNSE